MSSFGLQVYFPCAIGRLISISSSISGSIPSSPPHLRRYSFSFSSMLSLSDASVLLGSLAASSIRAFTSEVNASARLKVASR